VGSGAEPWPQTHDGEFLLWETLQMAAVFAILLYAGPSAKLL